VTGAVIYWYGSPSRQSVTSVGQTVVDNILVPAASPSPRVEVEVVEPGTSALLSIPVHYFQTFNNCGPASLAMVLSYFDINRTQQQLGNELRPYQLASGDNDDKSVTLEELAAKGEELGLVAYHRPVGDIELLKTFLANGIPVLTRTWTKVDEDIGHYRVVKGFDESQGVIIQDDSLQGKNLSFSYSDFLLMWEKFSYEYVVLVEPNRVTVAEAILGEDVDRRVAWQKAVGEARDTLAVDPNNIYSRFNLSVALYYTGDLEGAIAEFERVETSLPFRTLWYQIEPLLAYQELGRYGELLPRIANILENGNRAYSELYQIRGEIYLDQGNMEAARREFELALVYNENFESAREALENI